MALLGRDTDDEKAMAGALLVAEGLHHLREAGGLVKGMAQVGARRRG